MLCYVTLTLILWVCLLSICSTAILPRVRAAEEQDTAISCKNELVFRVRGTLPGYIN